MKSFSIRTLQRLTWKQIRRQRELLRQKIKKIAKGLELKDRIEKMQENECYITVKDHKVDFLHKIPCPVSNPSKSGIGKVGKVIFNKVSRVRFFLQCKLSNGKCHR